MNREFFRLDDDVYVAGRWHLTHPVDAQGRELAEPWRFTDGTKVEVPERLRVPIKLPGRALDFTMAGLGIPVVHVKVASVFTELAPDKVQLLPVDVPGQPEQYLILVAAQRIRCIDEQASTVQFWRPEDGLPDKVGQYYSVDDLRIDRAKAGDARVFRPQGWEVALIVSADIKAALERVGATGVKFTAV
ncbi:imm11 family protein [Pyxidicoccus sp. 3LFB2]